MIRDEDFEVVRRADEAGHFDDLWERLRAARVEIGERYGWPCADAEERKKRDRADEKVLSRYRGDLVKRISALLGRRVDVAFVAKYRHRHRALGAPKAGRT